MDYLLNIATLILISIILTQSYNLVLGYTGMIHVGHVGFMAIGAYTFALMTQSGFPFWIGLLSGIFTSGIIGFFLGLPTVRFREDYLVAATLGMGEIIRLIILNEREITGGSTGLPKIMRPDFFGISLHDNFSLFLFTFIITSIILIFVWRLVHAPFGKVLESIREDEIAAQSLGKNTTEKKLQILVIAALLAGLSGVLYATTIQFIDPESFNLQYMIFVFLIVVFGGSGNFWGPIVGSIFLYSLFEVLRFLPLPPHVLGHLRWILYALILITLMILKPKGIMGEKLMRKKL